MSPTEWVGGRVPSPMFVQSRGGFQADIIVWLDTTRDLIVGMEPVHPSDPDSRIVDVLRNALRKPLAGPKRPPDTIRVADTRLAELVAPVAGRIPVRVAPTPEVEGVAQRMRETMPEAMPVLEEFLRHLHEHEALTRRLLPAASRLFRAAPWSFLWDADVFQVDVPELHASSWCVSVLGRSEQTWGLGLLSADDYRAIRDAPDVDDDGPVNFGVEGISLTFGDLGELPTVIRRELAELGWDPANVAVCPLWFGSTREGKARMLTELELRILLAAVVGITDHVTRHRVDFAAATLPPARSETYAVETDGTDLTVRVTTPHPEFVWDRASRSPRKSSRRPNK